MEWKPIETAPMDGTTVLLYPATWNGYGCSMGYWDEDEYAKKPNPYWRRHDDMGRVSNSRSTPPTHWMPLPEPPK